MKIRNSFISNSSTSSFIIVGYRANAAILKELAQYHNLDISFYINDQEVISNMETICNRMGFDVIEEENIFGLNLQISSDDSMKSITIDKILETTEKLKEKTGLQENPKVFSGVIYC